MGKKASKKAKRRAKKEELRLGDGPIRCDLAANRLLLGASFGVWLHEESSQAEHEQRGEEEVQEDQEL